MQQDKWNGKKRFEREDDTMGQEKRDDVIGWEEGMERDEREGTT